MQAEWSAECGADDPVVVVPWHDPDSPLRFIDLRLNPDDLDHIAEAEQHPPLLQALRALNATRSPVFTAKCDVWTMPPDELEATQLELDLLPAEAPHGFASYIDLLWRERTLFVSLGQQQQRLTRLERLLAGVDQPYTRVASILRPAVVEASATGDTRTQDRTQEGFAITLYVKALGTDAAHAYEHWSAALAAVVTLLRSKDFQSN